MITRILGQQLCFTRFLCERDSLSACMTRLGHGFSPNTVLSEARYHLTNINSLLHQMEELALKPKDAIVAEDISHLMTKINKDSHPSSNRLQ